MGLVAIICLCCVTGLRGQKFHFGGVASVIASQVDGDNLRGFNKLGLSLGLLGGYSLSDAAWLDIELHYSTFGSARRNEDLGIQLETEIRTINILTAYSLSFGDSWDGIRRFRLLLGPRFHVVQSARIGSQGDQTDISRVLVSAHAGLGVFLTHNSILDLSYNQVLGNILKTEIREINRLDPYYLSLGISLYLHRD